MHGFWYVFAGFNVFLVAMVIVAVAVMSRRQRSGPTGPPTPEEQRQRWEARAPGWQIRCLKCNFSEPYGKYGIRLRAAGKKYTWGYCSQCRGFRFYVIEQDKAGRG